MSILRVYLMQCNIPREVSSLNVTNRTFFSFIILIVFVFITKKILKVFFGQIFPFIFQVYLQFLI